jgi:hypothetical protein
MQLGNDGRKSKCSFKNVTVVTVTYCRVVGGPRGEFRALKKTEKWFCKTRHELGTLPMLILDSLFPPAGPPAGGAAAPRVRGRWWQAQELLSIVAGACMQKKTAIYN